MFRLLIAVFILAVSVSSCNKDENETIADDNGFCLVEINGVFVEATLDQPQEYLNGGNDNFLVDLLKVLHYPSEAREKGIQGVCELEYEISMSGTVENIKANLDPGGGIGEAAIEALETITEGVSFSPGILEQMPVRIKKRIKLTFRL